MIELFFLLCVTIAAGIAFLSFRNNNQTQPTNRYRKAKKAIRTQLVRSAQSYSTMRPEAQKITLDNSSALEKTNVIKTDTQNPADTEFNQSTNDYTDADYVLGLKTSEKNQASQPDIHSRAAAKSSDRNERSADCIIVLYLMAPDNCVYAGYELLQALLSAGLRYGKQRIFHRHTHKDGRGDVLFHCASATEPGIFDLTKMGAFTSKGLCLFFSAASVEDPLMTFDHLLETIDQLVEDMGGQVLDGQRQLFTKERMVNLRQKLRAFMNNKTTADLFN